MTERPQGADAARDALVAALRPHLGGGDLTCILADHADVRVLDVDWSARFGPPTFVGRARTVHTNGGVAPIRAIVPTLRRGDVLVVRSSHPSVAVFGDRLAAAATTRGVAGVVIDGMVRDVAALEAGTLPVVARGVRPNRSDAAAMGTQDTRLAIGSTWLAPHDVVVGDRNGVVGIPASSFAAIFDGLDAWIDAEQTVSKR